MRTPHLAAAAAAALALAGASPATAATNETIFGLTTGNELVTFPSNDPAATSATLSISGVGTGEELLGLDARPATGGLYLLTKSAASFFVYRVDPVSGDATDKVTVTGTNTAPRGAEFGVDFNPTVDRLRVTSDAGQSLAVNVDTGATTANLDINGVTTRAHAAGYTNNFRAAAGTPTELIDIDTASDTVVAQVPATGVTTRRGPLGFDAGSNAAFDISAQDNLGFLAVKNGNDSSSTLYSVNVAAGESARAERIGALDSNVVLKGLTIAIQAPDLYVLNGGDGRTIRTLGSLPLGTAGGTTPLPEKYRTTVSGLGDGVTLRGIDVRPADGTLTGLTSDSRLVRIDPRTGASRVIATVAPAVAPGDIGIDWNPTVDRLRVVTEAGLNYAINPNDGVNTQQGTLNGTPEVSGAAYTTSFLGAAGTTTELYDYNTGAAPDELFVQAPPACGTFAAPSPCVTKVTPTNNQNGNRFLGFDITPQDDSGYVASIFDSGNGVDFVNRLHRIDLATAQQSVIGTLGDEAPSGLTAADIGSFSLAGDTFTVSESGGSFAIPVSRSGGQGTATVVVEYDGLKQSVTFTDGETLQQAFFSLENRANSTDEADRVFDIKLSRAAPGGVRLGTAAAKLTVLDDDPAVGPTRTTTVTQTRTVPAPVTPAPRDTTLPTFLIAGEDVQLSTLRRNGARFTYSCSESCTATVRLRLGTLTIGTATSRRTGPGITAVRIRLSASGRRRLASRRSNTLLNLRGSARDVAGNTSRVSTAKFTAKR